MKNLKSLLQMGLAISVVFCVFLYSGCQESEKADSGVGHIKLLPVFYPAPPEQVRLQFLRAISGEEDINEAVEVTGFEKFIVGDVQEQKQEIEKPHGIAIYDGKLYVCDVGKRTVLVLDLKEGTFRYMTKDRRLRNPAGIHIEPDGTKYISDAVVGVVFVFDKSDQMMAILGSDLGIKPTDVAVYGQHCYVGDATSQRIVVMDKVTGDEIARFGEDKQFRSITGIAVDGEGNIYASDKIKAQVTKFDPTGTVVATVAGLGQSIHGLVRPKGLAVDKDENIWVVDTATEVAKIYDPQGRLLLFFGMPGGGRGNMILPGEIWIDYDNVDVFKEYFAEGANIRFIVLVSNQFGAKINIYGFGEFPIPSRGVTDE
ncbi:MAG: NHL repeat-containing protein [Planctomycetota bacterium]|jgi:sugar lactone lactonase YvrE